MKEFLRKYKWVLIILLIIPITTIATFAVMEFYLHKIDLKAGEWAGFAGAILGYLGTILLGTLAFWQNEKASKINTILSEREYNKQLPRFQVEYGYTCDKLQENDNTKYKYLFQVRNTSTEFTVLNTFEMISIKFTEKNNDNIKLKAFLALFNDGNLASTGHILRESKGGMTYIKPLDVIGEFYVLKEDCFNGLQNHYENINVEIYFEFSCEDIFKNKHIYKFNLNDKFNLMDVVILEEEKTND